MPFAPLIALRNHVDVKHRLAGFGAILLTTALTGFVFAVLVPAQRDALVSLMERHGTLAIAIGAPAIVSVAWVLVVILKVHTHFYDRFFVKRKRRHDVEFLLPRLLEAFKDRLPAGFDLVSFIDNNRAVLKAALFDDFFDTPNDRTLSVRATRFLESIANYWCSELTELTLIVWTCGLMAYGTIGHWMGFVPSDWDAHLLAVLVVPAGLLFANGIWVRSCWRDVREKTVQEIGELVHRYADALESAFERVMSELNVPIGDASTGKNPWAELHGLGSTFPVIHSLANTSPVDVYLASPMASLTDVDYLRERQTALRVKEAILAAFRVGTVFYAGEHLHTSADFEDADVALRVDIARLQRCRVFVMIYPEALASSVLVELGYAMAYGKPAIYFVRKRESLPFVLRSVSQVFRRILVFQYKDEEDLIRIIEENGASLRSRLGLTRKES